MDTSLYSALGVGFLLGIRHAIDADHVAAVSTLVSQHRTLTRSCLLGTFWGIGHTLALLGAGVATIALRLGISPELERSLERGVGCMLILLGGHAILKSLAAWRLPTREHVHGWLPHCRRPFVVGLAHGMAGSAGLMIAVAAAVPSATGGMLYILVFGAGSTLGMLLLSGLIGLPFVLAADRTPRVVAVIRILAGVVSSGLGLTLLWAPSSAG